MILGSITYRKTAILDFSPSWVIGTPKAHIKFDSLEEAKQWLDEFLEDQKVLKVRDYMGAYGCFPSWEDLRNAVKYSGAHRRAQTIVNKYFYS